VLVDGNDVLAVYDAALAAVERARAGQGPTLLECITYRWRGHNEGEEAFIGKWSYRKKEELEEWMQRDPIARLRALCLEKNFLSSNELEQIDAEAAKEMEEAVSYAQQSPFPQPEEALIGLYKD
jgi:TPP-dependent pyruvate/acetoin dehydrogenase alpha subunit